MADFTQSQVQLWAHQSVARLNSITSAVVNVASAIEGQAVIHHAPTDAVAIGSGVIYLVQGSVLAAGDEDWVTLARFQTSVSAATSTTLSAPTGVGVSTLPVAADANFTQGITGYIVDGVVADGEWIFVEGNQSGGNNIEVVDPTTVAHAGATPVVTNAAVYTVRLNLGGLSRVRAVCIHGGATGNAIHTKAEFLMATDIV